MRAAWEAVHAGLERSVRTVKSRQLFEAMKIRTASLRPFADVAALVGYLTSTGGDLGEKDQIYFALVRAVRAGGADAQLALSIATLGLWPGLDRIFRRSLSHFDAGKPDEAAAELSSEITARFTTIVGSADLSNVNKLAATLVWNTFRGVVEGRHRIWREEARRGDLPDDDDLSRSSGPAPRDVSDLGMAPGHAAEEEAGAIRRWLESIVGRDAELVLAVVVDGDSQREAGERLGLNHEVARKRFQTAMRRIREHFDVAEEALSQLGRLPRISRASRNERK